MVRPFLCIVLCLIFGINFLWGQLNNPIFNGTHFNDFSHEGSSFYPALKLQSRSEGFGFQALHYLKNNEYMEAHNPGQTFYGVQVTGGIQKLLAEKSKVYMGALVNLPYGGFHKTKVFPLIQLQHQFTKKQHLILGSLHGTTRHQLYEPLYNYELALTRPLEYGVQYLYKGKSFESDVWLDWRQLAIRETSQQEIISFGWRSTLHLNPNNHKHKLSIPLSSLIYHQGGESLAIGKIVQNKWNGSIGLRYDYNSNLRFESVVFGSQDFSPQLTTSFKDGHALYNQIHVFPNKAHQFVISHYYAEEFFAPLGAQLFLSEQINNPYTFENYRNFIMARYQWMGVLIPETCIFDFRLEPIWHLEKQQFAFSAGFYVKYILGTELY